MQSFRLKVQCIESTCLFELMWGQGQQLMATVNYPANLTALYQEWQRAYLSFYKTVEMPLAPESNSITEANMRARVVESGRIEAAPIDWHSKLVQAETKLLNAFHYWLRSAELFEIRTAISAASRLGHTTPINTGLPQTNVFLTCYPLELARFPWEAWEIGADFINRSPIHIIRTPANIQAPSVAKKQRNKARILAILGDDTGLNFQVDREAVQSLAKVAEVTFVGWQPGQRPTEVKQQIQQAITDPQGWDVLFFAGHSNETAMTGGELAIAPNMAIQITEIIPHLTTAKNLGLQVAIFNSCSGLNIAESLIGLGFNQVVVMREPIHNRVAQEFLIQFLRRLATHQTLQESILAASQYLRLERNLTYPSAYLIPSLFCHPGSDLFHIPALGWKQRLRQVLPSRLEALALMTCLTLSLVPTIQNWLLDQRIGLQAVYRDLTHQVPPTHPAPVLLVQIDEESIRRDARLTNPSPINRAYLADLITRLTQLKASIIGIDYLLDRQAEESAILSQAIQSAIQQNQTWFVFGALYDRFESKNIFVTQESRVARPEWSLQGYLSLLPASMTLPYPEEDCRETCPFAYLLALLQTAQQEIPANLLPQPSLKSTSNLRTQLLDTLRQHSHSRSQFTSLERSRFLPISTWLYDTLGLVWLEPVVDFSIPPDRIYDRSAAWRILEKPLSLPHLASQVVLIGAGEYSDPSSALGDKLDIYPVPTAVRYWRRRLSPQNHAASFPNGNSQNSPTYLPVLTGSEVHAYILHHLLTQRLVIPIPDFWMVSLAALVGKGCSVTIRRQRYRWNRYQYQRFWAALVISTSLYGLVGWQLYISSAILFPWLLPSLMLWFYVLSTLKKQSYD